MVSFLESIIAVLCMAYIMTVGAQVTDECDLVADVNFIFDKSGSISMKPGSGKRDINLANDRFTTMKEFVSIVMDGLTIGKEQTNIAFTSFNSKTKIESKFTQDESYVKSKLTAELNSIRYNEDDLYQGTELGEAMEKVHKDVFSKGNRVPSRQSVPKVLIILTDGAATDNAVDVGKNLRRNHDYEILALAIGNVDLNQLREITGSNDNIFYSDDFDSIFEQIEGISNKICAINCGVTQWSTWSTCGLQTGQVCGSGTQKRSRTITIEQENNGKECPALDEEKDCNIECIPCSVSGWSQWSECKTDDVCGSGTRKKERSILETGSYPDECPDLTEAEPCEKPCVPCSVSAWSEWTQCVPNEICGNGTQIRERTIKEVGSKPEECPPVAETQTCDSPCIPCTMTEWAEWSVCLLSNNADCGNGEQKRERNILEQGHFPEECPGNEQRQDCNIVCEPCVSNEWGEWSSCAVINGTCGEGEQLRTRLIIEGSSTSICPEGEEVSNCTVPCPVPVTNEDDGVNVAAIAGGAAAGAAVLGAAALAGAYFWKQSASTKTANGSFDEITNPSDQNPLFESGVYESTNALNVDV